MSDDEKVDRSDGTMVLDQSLLPPKLAPRSTGPGAAGAAPVAPPIPPVIGPPAASSPTPPSGSPVPSVVEAEVGDETKSLDQYLTTGQLEKPAGDSTIHMTGLAPALTPPGSGPGLVTTPEPPSAPADAPSPRRHSPAGGVSPSAPASVPPLPGTAETASATGRTGGADPAGAAARGEDSRIAGDPTWDCTSPTLHHALQLQRLQPADRQGTILVENPVSTIGRALECDIPLYSRSASRRHAQIERRGTNWYLRPLDGRRVVVDGNIVDGEMALKSQMHLYFGDDELLVGDIASSAECSAEEASARDHTALLVVAVGLLSALLVVAWLLARILGLL